MQYTAFEQLETIASDFFGLILPMMASDLKSAFRKEVKRLHPDAKKDENGDSLLFGKTTDAYKLLLSFKGDPRVFVNVSESNFQMTVYGVPLSELGKGLGSTQNGENCPICQHDGYTTSQQVSFVICQPCEGSGRSPKFYKCLRCSGTGRKDESSSCPTCEGSGKFKHPYHKTRCHTCVGNGEVIGDPQTVYHRCVRCDGVGELPIYNAVLQKGALGLGGVTSA